MHKFDSPDDILTHFGTKGMRWGVRKDQKGPHKLDRHPAIKKYGKNPIREMRRLEAKFDPNHVDVKTGKYTHQNKSAKVARAVDKTLSLASTVLVSTLG